MRQSLAKCLRKHGNNQRTNTVCGGRLNGGDSEILMLLLLSKLAKTWVADEAISFLRGTQHRERLER